MSFLKNAAQLRQQIESAYSTRIPAALSVRARTALNRTPCGIAELDELLQGGLPTGVITELVGPNGSGRTTMALAYMAALTRSGSVFVWVDLADALDPESVAANGVDLERMLWVRCGSPKSALVQITSDFGHNDPTPISREASSPRHTGGGSPHPRSEGRDMPQAVAAMLHAHGGLYDRQARRERKAIGTPGMPNRPVTGRSEQREEQVNSDRLPPRRGDNLAIAARCAEPQPRRVASVPPEKTMPVTRDRFKLIKTAAGNPWQAVDQALRATDLLLQAGGFSAIVLDMGSIPPEIAWRVPLATWFRFRAACERSRVSLLLLTQHPCARSSAELVVRLEIGSMEAEGKVMNGVRYHATTERSRSRENDRVVPLRKPPQSEKPSQTAKPGQWKSEAAWMRTR